eukprot:68804-Rhodomonas_salina.1
MAEDCVHERRNGAGQPSGWRLKKKREKKNARLSFRAGTCELLEGAVHLLLGLLERLDLSLDLGLGLSGLQQLVLDAPHVHPDRVQLVPQRRGPLRLLHRTPPRPRSQHPALRHGRLMLCALSVCITIPLCASCLTAATAVLVERQGARKPRQPCCRWLPVRRRRPLSA